MKNSVEIRTFGRRARGRATLWTRMRLAAGLLGGALLAGCGKAGQPEPAGQRALEPVVLQTDWFAQPEHGGFYQALARGFYEEVGLAVTIQPGGPNAMTTQQVLRGRAHFAMNRADTIYGLAARGVPVVMVMATLQHDAQGILLHDSNPIRTFKELDRQRVMAVPGLMWVRWLERKYGIELTIIPHDFGMERFLRNPLFIQQCLITNEPYFAEQEGVKTRVLVLRDSGFDPYHGIYAHEDLVSARPDLVERFVAASIRGWRDFILGDPAPAFALIAEANPKMTPSFMAFSHGVLKSTGLVTGDDPSGNRIGHLDPARMQAMIEELLALDLVDPLPAGRVWFTTGFLPE